MADIVMARWMYGDCNELAYHNPLRWSKWLSIKRIKAHLLGVTRRENRPIYEGNRPVWLKVKLADKEGSAWKEYQGAVRAIEENPILNGVDAIRQLEQLACAIAPIVEDKPPHPAAPTDGTHRTGSSVGQDVASANMFKKVKVGPSGLAWKNVGRIEPEEVWKGGRQQGRKLRSDALASALQSRTVLSQEEWDTFGIKDLSIHDFVKSGMWYFKPVDSHVWARVQPGVSSQWTRLGNEYFVKRDVYATGWGDLDLKQHIVAVARCGGPVAVMPRRPAGDTTGVSIYTISGQPVSSFEGAHGEVLAMGWTDKERLVVVSKAGRVALWTMQGEQLRQFDLERRLFSQRLGACPTANAEGPVPI